MTTKLLTPHDVNCAANEDKRKPERPRLYHVWGRGPAQSNLIRDAEASEAAARTALAHGFDPGADSDCWAVEVEASETEIDAATRHDAAVTAYVEVVTLRISVCETGSDYVETIDDTLRVTIPVDSDDEAAVEAAVAVVEAAGHTVIRNRAGGCCEVVDLGEEIVAITVIPPDSRTPREAYERWVGGQSVVDFLDGDSPEAAVNEYIRQITEHPGGGPVEQYGREPTVNEQELILAHIRRHTSGESEQLSLSAVAKLLGITRQAASMRVSRGTFPPADGHIREPGGDRPYWLRPTVLRYQIEREVGPIAGLSDQGGLDNLRETYNLATDHPLGAQLAGQGLLTDEQGRLLDDLLPVFDLRGRIIDYEAAVNLMDDELREELHVELPPCSRQKFLVEYAVRHYKRFGESFAPWIGGAW